MNIDIAKLLESHRNHILEYARSLYTADEAEEGAGGLQAMAAAHDRATTKTLLDLYRQGQGENSAGTVANAAPVAVINTPPSRRVKAGSKKARDRAAKAQVTRRNNLANKNANAGGANGETALSPATHLALAKVEGETGGAA